MQAKVLDRWDDGSIRWALVDSVVDLRAGQGAARRLVAESTPATETAAKPVSVQVQGDDCVVETGAARFTMRAGSAFPFAGASQFTLTDQAGVAHVATLRKVTVLDRGPVRATVVATAAIPAGAMAALQVQAQIDFYAGSPTVRIALRIRNPQAAQHPGGFWDLGDAGSILIKNASLAIALPAGPGASVVHYSAEMGAAWTAATSPVEIYQDSSGGENWQSTAHLNRERRVPNSFRGYRLRSGETTTEGLRATPIVSVEREAATLSAAVPQFWQNFPKALEATDTAVTIRFLPRQYADTHELQGGEQKTHVCFVAFGRDGVTESPLEWCRTPISVHVDPSWTLSSGAVPWLSPDDPDHRSLISSAIEGADTFERKREVVDEYGWRHFGDVYGDHEAIRHKGPMPLVSHYNNQYDTVAGFLYQYLRTGDRRWWAMATELSAHVIDIDVYHTDRDKWAYNHGLFWHTYHYGDADTSTHRTYPRAGRGETHGGGPSPDHNYTTGLMLHYFLTGDEASRDTVVDLAQFVIDADDGRKTQLRWLSGANTGYATASGSYAYHGPGRGPANALNALVDGHRLTGEARFLEKAEQIIRRVVHPTEDISKLQLDDPENKWFYLMFLQSLGKYLRHKADFGTLDEMYAYGRATLLHYARWMAEHEYPYLDRPERLTFPTETWAAHEIRKSDVFCHAALHASGEERTRFIERGRHFFRLSIDSLRSKPTRTLARPVIVLLSSGLMQPWLDANPSASAPPPARPDASFAPRVPFVPQKQQALKRLKMLVAIGGATLIGLTALAAYWLLSH